MDDNKLLERNYEDLMQPHLITGEERYLIKQLLSRIEKRFMNSGEKFDKIKLEDEADDFLRELNQSVYNIGMLSDYKFIIVECNDLFSRSTGFDEKVIEIINNTPENAAIFFYAVGGVDGRLKTVNTIKKAGEFVELNSPRSGELKEWINKKFQALDKKPDRELVEKLSFLFGKNLEALNKEIEKLATFKFADDNLHFEECKDVLSQEGITGEKIIFELVDCWARGDKPGAVRLYREIIKNGRSPVYVLSMLKRQLRLLLSVKEARKAHGDNHRQIAGQLQEHPYAIKKCLKQEKKFEREDLLAALKKLLRANRRIVRGKYIDKKDPVEDFLLQI